MKVSGHAKLVKQKLYIILYFIGFKLESTISLRFDGSISNIAALNVPTIEEAVATIKGCRKQSLLTDTAIPYRRKQQIKVGISNLKKKTFFLLQLFFNTAK